VPRPVEPVDPPDRLGVVADPVVLATGGARGITARLVGELLTDGPPRSVWLLGTGPAPDLAGPTALPSRPAALRELMARHPGEKVASLNRRFEAAVQEAQRVATILDLRRRFGADRVHYRQCDVRDAEQVAAVVNEILLVEGRVDVVVHGAGLVRSTALARKDLDDYRLVRDVKVLGDRNLRAALTAASPALWCSISSVGAFIGMRGEADYQAGNEYLLLGAAAARAAGRDEVALVSGLWTESGMASGYAVGSPFSTGLADFTQLTDSQGVEFFRAELAGRGGPGLAATWLGDAEWSTIHRHAPGLRERSRVATPPGPALLAEPAGQDGAATVWCCEIGLDRFCWLLDHLVDDRPTVPATVMIEIAAEAAAHLAPGLVPARFTDVVLSRFIRAPRSRWPRQVEVTATRSGDAVQVRLASPPAGLVPAFEHARMTVWLAIAPDPPARVAPPRPTGSDAPDVYQLGGSLQLSGVFAGLHGARLHHDGGSALFRLPVDDQFDGFLMPSVALDAVLRASVLDGRRPDSVTMIVPTAIREITIHTVGNDPELARRWGAEITLRHCSDPAGGAGRCLATAHDGTVLFEMDGISGSPRETYDLGSGRWLGHSDLPESVLAD
jgi:NAD(P)-dependent dehydrogenase (short-subunit alcohol dehydrogenase family)